MTAARSRDARSRPDPRPDNALLALVAEGNLGALGELYDRYYTDVWSVLHRVGTPSTDVEDLIQATFLELPKIAGGFDGRDSCRAWLCGIAVRLASRRRRSLGRWLRAVATFAQSRPGETLMTPESEVGDAEELRVLARALSALGPKKREAFVLLELEGLSAEQAARALGVPAATLRTRLFHAKRELREAMKRGGAW